MSDLILEKQVQISPSYEQLGADWVQAVAKKDMENLKHFCHPELSSHLLTPGRYSKNDTVEDLVKRYKIWFGECTHIHLDDCRINQVGQKVGIYYRLSLKENDEWFVVEQQLYCTLDEGLISQLQLICSGFQPLLREGYQDVEENDQKSKDLLRHDELLEMNTKTSEAVCSILTPGIRSKIREMQIGQVLEVRVNDNTAKGDIESWCRLSGNTLLNVVADEEPKMRFFIRKN